MKHINGVKRTIVPLLEKIKEFSRVQIDDGGSGRRGCVVRAEERVTGILTEWSQVLRAKSTFVPP